jgi:hypothetical protein
MPVADSCGGPKGLSDLALEKLNREPPPQPTPEQIATFRAQLTEETTEERAPHDRNRDETRHIQGRDIRNHNLHVLFMDDLAILEANVKGPEKADKVRGGATLTIDINMTAVPYNPVLIWEKPCVIEAQGDCIDIHLDGHAPRPGQLGYDPARPGRVHLEFVVPSLEEVPNLIFHKTDDATFSLLPFRDLEIPPLPPVLEVPEPPKVTAADKGQQAAAFDSRQDPGARPGTAIPAPKEEVPISAPSPTTIPPDTGTRIKPFFQSLARLAPGVDGEKPPIPLPPIFAGREIPAIPPVDGKLPTAPIPAEGGPTSSAIPVRLSVDKRPAVEFPAPPAIEVPLADPVRLSVDKPPVLEFPAPPAIEVPLADPVRLSVDKPPVVEFPAPPAIDVSSAAPVRLSVDKPQVGESPVPPAVEVPLDLRVKALDVPVIPVVAESVAPDIPPAVEADAETAPGVKASVLSAYPADILTNLRPPQPVDGSDPALVDIRIDPVRPEERAWALMGDVVPGAPFRLEVSSVESETGVSLSLRDPEVHPVTDAHGKPPEKRDTGYRRDEEETERDPEVISLQAAGTLYQPWWDPSLFNVPAGQPQPFRARGGNEELAHELVDMVDRFLVTAEPGAYVKELRMTMNPDVMPGTEIHMRMVDTRLTVTFVNKDGNMADQLRPAVPELAASLQAHLGSEVEIRIVTGDGRMIV